MGRSQGVFLWNLMDFFACFDIKNGKTTFNHFSNSFLTVGFDPYFCQDAQQRAFLAITLEASFRLHIGRFLEILDMISTNAQWVWCKCNFQFCFATCCNKSVQLVQLVLLGVCWCVPGRNGWISPATCWSRSAATQVQITWNRETWSARGVAALCFTYTYLVYFGFATWYTLDLLLV